MDLLCSDCHKKKNQTWVIYGKNVRFGPLAWNVNVALVFIFILFLVEWLEFDLTSAILNLPASWACTCPWS